MSNEIVHIERKKSLTPQLRFKEFNDDWLTRTLEEVTDIFKSGESITSKDIFDSGEFPVYGGNGLRGYTNTFTHDGFFVLIGRQGALCGNINRVKGKSFISEHAIAVQSNKLSDTEWLAQKLDDMKLNRLSESSAQPGLAVGKLLKLKLKFPTLPEQQKIASFLSSVDEKIQQLTRKKEMLEQYKKGVMQQLFTSSELGLEGLEDDRISAEATNPTIRSSQKSQFRQLRFKDENGKAYPKWEEKRLGEVGEIVTGKTPSTTDLDLWGGEIQFVTPTDINGQKYQLETQRSIKRLPTTKVLPAKSIIFTCIASIGKMSLSLKPCITNQQINTIVPSQNFDNEFVYYSLLNIVDYIKSTQSTTTLPIINKTEFSKFKIAMPSSFAEQQKIASFLSAIDTKIESVANQITQTQTFKKGLLQQMFV